MLKKLIVLSMMLVCCYCLENNEQLPEEARAKKKKGLRLLAMLALAIFSKVTVVKIATFFFFFTFFQKLFYLGGIFLNYYLKNQGSSPQTAYGPPQDYNTVGYSYDAPDAEPFHPPEGLPGLGEISNGFHWLFKNHA